MAQTYLQIMVDGMPERGIRTLSREELVELYMVQNLSLDFLSLVFCCSRSHVRMTLSRHGIVKRGTKAIAKPISKEILETHYVDGGLTIAETAGALGTSPLRVAKWMDKHGIRVKSYAKFDQTMKEKMPPAFIMPHDGFG